MTKTEFINDFAKRTGETKKRAKELVDEFLNSLEENTKKEGEVSFVKFGKFVKAKRKARKGRNPQTGTELQIPEKEAFVFRAFKNLKTL